MTNHLNSGHKSAAKHTPSMRETEYSKKWAQEHPALFTANLIEFIEQHPAPYWEFTLTTTGGFFTLRAIIAKATGGAQ